VGAAEQITCLGWQRFHEAADPIRGGQQRFNFLAQQWITGAGSREDKGALIWLAVEYVV
jgi:hypothetical protein